MRVETIFEALLYLSKRVDILLCAPTVTGSQQWKSSNISVLRQPLRFAPPRPTSKSSAISHGGVDSSIGAFSSTTSSDDAAVFPFVGDDGSDFCCLYVSIMGRVRTCRLRLRWAYSMMCAAFLSLLLSSELEVSLLAIASRRGAALPNLAHSVLHHAMPTA